MNLTKCKNGHYYDADKYPNCPHCTGGVNTDDDVTVNMEQTGTGFGNSQGISQTVGFWEPSQSQSSPSPSSVTLGPGNGPVSLMQAVNAAAAVPVNVQQEADEDKTVSYYGGTLETEPVVGWLVCIEGKQLGKAFELKNGKNFIGRSPQMDIVLEGDANVSRDRHAIVTYEPKGRAFFAQPGESRELFYVNGQVVLMNVVLQHKDVISVGKTQLMFVPLCGSDFSWDEMKKQ
ncbi:FHA domain-containing protein [Candidatus Ventrimonas sp. KK005]